MFRPSPLRSPVALRQRRHAQQNAAARVTARSLVIAEIKQLILFDRGRQWRRRTDSIASPESARPFVPKMRQRLGEWIARLYVIVAQKFERAAVHRVCARFGLRSSPPPPRRCRTRRRNRRWSPWLRHRFQSRVDHDPAEHRVVVIRPIQQVRDSREALAIHQQAIRALRVLRLCGCQADRP